MRYKTNLQIQDCLNIHKKPNQIFQPKADLPEGWRMVKSETRRDAEILVRNPSPRLFGEKFRDSKKVKTNHEKTRLRDLSKTFPRFRDPAKIFRDSCFSRYHSPPLLSIAHFKYGCYSVILKCEQISAILLTP